MHLQGCKLHWGTWPAPDTAARCELSRRRGGEGRGRRQVRAGRDLPPHWLLGDETEEMTAALSVAPLWSHPFHFSYRVKIKLKPKKKKKSRHLKTNASYSIKSVLNHCHPKSYFIKVTEKNRAQLRSLKGFNQNDEWWPLLSLLARLGTYFSVVFVFLKRRNPEGQPTCKDFVVGDLHLSKRDVCPLRLVLDTAWAAPGFGRRCAWGIPKQTPHLAEEETSSGPRVADPSPRPLAGQAGTPL